MKGYHEMHRAQVRTLHYLRHTPQATFGKLARVCDMSSDDYKFHLRRLQTLRHITKRDDGQYELTSSGKELTNRLSEATGYEVVQPKSSMLLIVMAAEDETTYYLAHQRARQPFYGVWGVVSAPIVRGQIMGVAAAAELAKQTGIEAKFTNRGSLRVIDVTPDGDLLEDKVFALMSATLPRRTAIHEWHGGKSIWMTRDELLGMEPLFASTAKALDMLADGVYYDEHSCVYTRDEY